MKPLYIRYRWWRLRAAVRRQVARPAVLAVVCVASVALMLFWREALEWLGILRVCRDYVTIGPEG